MAFCHSVHTCPCLTKQVTLSNNKKYGATLKGAEPDKDLAGGSERIGCLSFEHMNCNHARVPLPPCP
jgi:hypothetical protein